MVGYLRSDHRPAPANRMELPTGPGHQNIWNPADDLFRRGSLRHRSR
ncbi:MAG: hypothetical protein JWN03_8466 [Nocardia sp.]|nr:hypothetical protein [Nocardia sp.]